MTKFEKETRHWLYVFIKKKLLTQQIARQQAMHMMGSVHLHRYDVLTVPVTVLLHSNYKHDAHTIQLVLKSGW